VEARAELRGPGHRPRRDEGWGGCSDRRGLGRRCQVASPPRRFRPRFSNTSRIGGFVRDARLFTADRSPERSRAGSSTPSSRTNRVAPSRGRTRTD